MKSWENFIASHGFRANSYDLSAVLGQTPAEIERIRRTNICTRLRKPKKFAELFTLWHGRPPRNQDWPAPRKCYRNGHYEWQAPEVAFIAGLVGRMGQKQIAKILTVRLRKVTRDPRARRTWMAVNNAINRMGLMTTDVVGGITAKAASREIGSYTATWQAIRTRKLGAYRVGRVWVIPHAEWERFKAKRELPPKGYVQLSSIRQALGIKSDAKLPDWASRGYIPTAVLLKSWGTKHHKSVRGAWWVSRAVARKLVADRRAGRPMPWHGKPDPGNLSVTYKLWRSRQHPATCTACAQIWGKKGAPRTYEDYTLRYPPLDLGAKRHLTMKWARGLTVSEVSRQSRRSVYYVQLAIKNGMLDASREGGRIYVSRTEATRWKAGRSPSGASDRSWMSLAAARRFYLFTLKQLRIFIRKGRLRSKRGTNGPMRGVTYVPRRQLARLRERIGFSEAEAARRCGVSIARMRTLLKGVDWRGAERIPLATVQAAGKRKYSQDSGYTIPEAAKELGVTVKWIHDRKLDGTIRIRRAKFDHRRLYITEPMLERLRSAKTRLVKPERITSESLLLSEAANEAGVSTCQIILWAKRRELARRPSILGMRYHRRSVRARARRYWQRECRYKRAIPPAWLQQELRATA